jgi:hypothetical protein
MALENYISSEQSYATARYYCLSDVGSSEKTIKCLVAILCVSW